MLKILHFLLLVSINSSLVTKKSQIKRSLNPIKISETSLISHLRSIKDGILFSENSSPEITIFIPTYNKETFIDSVVKSVQAQVFKNVEILFLDDKSKDNTVDLVKKYMKIDRRIVLYEKEKNKGIFHSRCLIPSISKGKYLISLDSDDLLLSHNLLGTLYNEVHAYDLDILEFQVFEGEENNIRFRDNTHTKNRILRQPELGHKFLFYEHGYYKMRTHNIK